MSGSIDLEARLGTALTTASIGVTTRGVRAPHHMLPDLDDVLTAGNRRSASTATTYRMLVGWGRSVPAVWARPPWSLRLTRTSFGE